MRVFTGHKDAVLDVDFSPDGKFLVTASRDHDARVWDVATGDERLPPRALRAGLPCLVQPGRPLDRHRRPDHGGALERAAPPAAPLPPRPRGRSSTSASSGPDGSRILTSSPDGTVRGYDCLVCGSLDDLVVVADARVAAIAGPLTPEQRQLYLATD